MLTYATDMHWNNTFAPAKLIGIPYYIILSTWPSQEKYRKIMRFNYHRPIISTRCTKLWMYHRYIRVLTPIIHHLYQSCMTYHLWSTSANSSSHRTSFNKMKQRDAEKIELSVLIDFVIIDRQNQWPMNFWVISVWWLCALWLVPQKK